VVVTLDGCSPTILAGLPETIANGGITFKNKKYLILLYVRYK
jgi:hypothetical protein